MQLSKACKIIKGEQLGDDVNFFGAATDTRLLKAGQLFFAWQGENYDGHQFLEQALAKGASAAVVEKFYPHIELPQIKVKNSQLALGQLAKAWRKEWKGKCIAITGSNGKTTLKEMLRSIHEAYITQLEATNHKVHATYGNLNNHVGCPLTLLALKPKHQFAIIEMGANHEKEIAYLTKITKPDIAVLNNAGTCHLEGFGSLEGVAKAKGEIFQGIEKEGIAILNADDQFFKYWQSVVKNPFISFGLNSQDANVYASDIQNNNFTLHLPKDLKSVLQETHLTSEKKNDEQTCKINLQLDGEHNIRNALAAAAAAFANQIPLSAIQKGLEQLQPVKGRLQKIHLSHNIVLINDSYNANPSSLRAGINAIQSAQRWLVLGDMNELGSDAVHLHEESGKYAQSQGFSKLFTLGDLSFSACNAFGEGALHSHSHEQLANSLISAIKEYMVDQKAPSLNILVKGSFSMNMGKIIDQLTKEFSCSTD